MGKRTSIDWSKHELIVEKDSLCKIHWLKKPETNNYNVKFIHVDGILLVKGDFGRWTFNRDFDPEKFDKTGISDSFWCEKIQIGSEQDPYVFDSEIAEKAIKQRIESLTDNYGAKNGDEWEFENEWQEEAYEFWGGMLNNCNDEIELNTYFRDNIPDSLDFDYFPDCKKQHKYLDGIFDAFEEISKRLAENETPI